MLDEAFGTDDASSGQFIDDRRKAEDMMENGLPRGVKDCDIFEYSEGGTSVAFACYRDWPAPNMTCVVGGFVLHKGKWTPLGRNGRLQAYKDAILAAAEKLTDQCAVWIPVFSKNISKAVNLKTFAWEPYFWYKGVFGNTDLFHQYDGPDDIYVMDRIPQQKSIDLDVDCSDIVWLSSDKRLDGKIRDMLVSRLAANVKKCKGESYFEVWQKQRGHGLGDICGQLARKMDEKVMKTFGTGFAKEAAEFLASALEQNKYWIDYDDYPFDLSKLVDRRDWWDLIRDDVYKALVSRAAHPERSRGVSARVVYDCLDKICYDFSVLYAQSRKVPRIFEKSGFYTNLLRECEKAGLTKYVANNFMEKILESCGSYVDKDTFQNDIHGGWASDGFDPVSNTDFSMTLTGFFNILDVIRYDEQNMQYLIGQISMLIDQAHVRGSMAGAFIEGGAATCTAVSNMKPNELHERKKPAQAEHAEAKRRTSTRVHF